MEIPVPGKCAICEGTLKIERLACESCGCAIEGDFSQTRLGRLQPEEQRFIELFVTLSGSLKDMASALGISYPTVRNRLDGVIASLEKLIEEDKNRREGLIDGVERGEIRPDLAARILEET